jgi:hypothetical protein
MAATNAAPRRTLKFTAIDDALAEFERLAAAKAAGTLSTCGTWTFGQTLNHLATWVDYCYDGVPMKMRWPVRLIMRALKRQILTKPMRAGSRIPGVPAGTLATDRVPDEVGIAHFRRSFARLRDEPPTMAHMAFGPMTHAEWVALHLRHAELHLSFFRTAVR